MISELKGVFLYCRDSYIPAVGANTTWLNWFKTFKEVMGNLKDSKEHLNYEEIGNIQMVVCYP